jgi:Flp pilus assembly protein TadG
MSPRTFLRRLLQDRRGDATVQFAMLAPALILFILGAFEFAIIIFVSSSLEAAVLLASRYGITGSVSGNVTREDRIRAIIEERTFGFVDMATAQIHTKVYPSFNSVGQPEPLNDSNHNGQRDAGESYTDTNGNGQWDNDMGVAGMGGPGDIVLYQVEYQTHSITALLEPIIGEFTHRAAVAVRNEPP